MLHATFISNFYCPRLQQEIGETSLATRMNSLHRHIADLVIHLIIIEGGWRLSRVTEYFLKLCSKPTINC